MFFNEPFLFKYIKPYIIDELSSEQDDFRRSSLYLVHASLIPFLVPPVQESSKDSFLNPFSESK
jgi:hypothetical protein